MNLTRFEPWSIVDLLHRDLDRLAARRIPAGDSEAPVADWVPAVDIIEENERFVLRADVPGVDPADIGGGGKIFIWGIRDEPVPVGYVRGFRPGEGAQPVDLQVRSMGGRPVMSYRSGDSLNYSIDEKDGWSETRHMNLSESFGVRAARLEIERSIERRSTETGPN